jgi:general stress protein 26
LRLRKRKRTAVAFTLLCLAQCDLEFPQEIASVTIKTLPELSKDMAGIDFAMLLTHTASGDIAGRPMSNNGDIEYDGDSWFFAMQHTQVVQQIEAHPKVALSFSGSKSLFGKPPLFVAVEAHGEVLRDRGVLEQHWQKSLERWFEQGLDTPGLVLLKVHASRITWWDGEDEGEIIP